MPDTAITLDFGDARYKFWLPMARVVEVERLCGDKSILAMHEEMGGALGIDQANDNATVFMGGGDGRLKDIYEVIRCGAIGGNERHDGSETSPVSAIDAKRLVDNYVDGRPISETLPVAWAILNAAVMGVSLKKKAQPEAGDPSHTEKVMS